MRVSKTCVSLETAARILGYHGGGPLLWNQAQNMVTIHLKVLKVI